MTWELLREIIETERKWLYMVGYNAYNVDIAFSAIISAVRDLEQEASE